jgi:hypothetical protein
VPAASRQVPAASRQVPAASRQVPAASRQVPAAGRQPPAASCGAGSYIPAARGPQYGWERQPAPKTVATQAVRYGPSFLAPAADGDIERPGPDGRAIAPHPLQQVLARYRFAGVLYQ